VEHLAVGSEAFDEEFHQWRDELHRQLASGLLVVRRVEPSVAINRPIPRSGLPGAREVPRELDTCCLRWRQADALRGHIRVDPLAGIKLVLGVVDGSHDCCETRIPLDEVDEVPELLLPDLVVGSRESCKRSSSWPDKSLVAVTRELIIACDVDAPVRSLPPRQPGRRLRLAWRGWRARIGAVLCGLCAAGSGRRRGGHRADSEAVAPLEPGCRFRDLPFVVSVTSTGRLNAAASRCEGHPTGRKVGIGGPTSAGLGGPIGAKITGSRLAGTTDGASTVDTNMSAAASASTAPRIASRTCVPML
jgi:hypothetical protein